jgi:hypothetical protein
MLFVNTDHLTLLRLSEKTKNPRLAGWTMLFKTYKWY